MLNAPQYIRFIHIAVLSMATIAQASSGVSLDVSRIELSTEPGGKITHTVTVTNPGKKGEPPMLIEPYLNDFLLPKNGKAKFLPAGSSKSTLTRWFNVSPAKFNLAPSSSQKIRYTIDIPADTKPGLYWGVLFFKSDGKGEKDKEKGIGIKYNVDVGQIIYVQVGKPKMNAKLSSFKANYDNGELQVNAIINNAGSALVRAVGRAVVINDSGKEMGTLPIEESVALPGYSRTFTGLSKLKLPKGKYQVIMALKYAQNKRFTGQVDLAVK